jgi:hypothetical protein
MIKVMTRYPRGTRRLLLTAVLALPLIAGCTAGDKFRWVAVVNKCGRPIQEQALWGSGGPVDGWTDLAAEATTLEPYDPVVDPVTMYLWTRSGPDGKPVGSQVAYSTFTKVPPGRKYQTTIDISGARCP